jgi:hypothetical protein
MHTVSIEQVPPEFRDDPRLRILVANSERWLNHPELCPPNSAEHPASRLDERLKYRIAAHESGHFVYFQRMGWKTKLVGPEIAFRNNQFYFQPAGLVPLNEVEDGAGKIDKFDVLKAFLGGPILVELLTGEPDAFLKGDIENVKRWLGVGPADVFEYADLLLEVTSRIIDDLQDPAFVKQIQKTMHEFARQLYPELNN